MDIFFASCHKKFSLSPSCPVCSQVAESVRPQKYSHDDKYAAYRRKALSVQRQARGLL